MRSMSSNGGLRARRAYPHTEVGVHSTGSSPGRPAWMVPPACGPARSPPDTLSCWRRCCCCTSEIHSWDGRGAGRNELQVERYEMLKKTKPNPALTHVYNIILFPHQNAGTVHKSGGGEGHKSSAGMFSYYLTQGSGLSLNTE